MVSQLFIACQPFELVACCNIDLVEQAADYGYLVQLLYPLQ